MKPFDLNDALSGKPVKLRGGSKAYVIGLLPNAIKTDYALLRVNNLAVLELISKGLSSFFLV